MAEYYVRSTGGSDSNAGTSFSNGWATLAYAFSNISAGDYLYICSDSVNPFTITASLSPITAAGSYVTKYIGASSDTGVAYSGTARAYIKAGSSITSMFLDNVDYPFLLQDIDFDGNSNCSYCYNHSNLDTFGRFILNCSFHGANLYGAYMASQATPAVLLQSFSVSFVNCDFYDNGSLSGIGLVGSGSQGSPVVILDNCNIYDNNYGIRNYSPYHILIIKNSRIYKNNYEGILTFTSGITISLTNNVIEGNGSSGILLNFDSYINHFYNNIIANNDGYGISSSSAVIQIFGNYNCFYNNTSGNVNSNINGGTVPGSNNILSDPQFINIVSGSEDYRLKPSSPCLQAGLSFTGGK